MDNELGLTTTNGDAVLAVDTANNAILVKGAVPGPNKGLVTIKNAIKA